MTIQLWIATLNDEGLAHLEYAASAERYKRARQCAVPTDDAVGREVDRLLTVQAARRKEAADAREAHVVRCLKRRIQQFEEGRLGMCACRDCLAGYVALDPSLMCPKGEWEFWGDANQWQPYTP
ncbi:MAG: hypothetical protein LAQ69_20210 [Acidobacteriia bacterium]|nr:hypothetical protein [Terriglobia bacterium]